MISQSMNTDANNGWITQMHSASWNGSCATEQTQHTVWIYNVACYFGAGVY